jgi:hypothetical protein
MQLNEHDDEDKQIATGWRINQYCFSPKRQATINHNPVNNLTFMCKAKDIHLRAERKTQIGSACKVLQQMQLTKNYKSTKMDNRASKLLRQCCNDVPVLADIQH